MAVSVLPPFPTLPGIDGAPLEAGYVYIGTANTNPLVAANRIAVFSDAALSVPLTQPLRTSGGFIVNGSGTPINVYAATDFSITVQDRRNRTLYSLPAYGFRALASALTLDNIIVGVSIVPDTAGGAFSGTVLLPWSNNVTRDFQAKTGAVYNTAVPVVPADLVNFHQARQPVLIGRQTSTGASATAVGIYNLNSITRTALGRYDIVPIVAMPATMSIQLQETLDTGSNQDLIIQTRGASLIQVRTYTGGAATDLPFDFVAYGNPAVADPIA